MSKSIIPLSSLILEYFWNLSDQDLQGDYSCRKKNTFENLLEYLKNYDLDFKESEEYIKLVQYELSHLMNQKVIRSEIDIELLIWKYMNSYCVWDTQYELSIDTRYILEVNRDIYRNDRKRKTTSKTYYKLIATPSSISEKPTEIYLPDDYEYYGSFYFLDKKLVVRKDIFLVEEDDELGIELLEAELLEEPPRKKMKPNINLEVQENS